MNFYETVFIETLKALFVGKSFEDLDFYENADKYVLLAGCYARKAVAERDRPND